MRISIPNILIRSGAITPQISPASAIERIVTFLQPGNVAALTGAGVSVDSGIRAYRGRDGRYMNPNYKPIFFHELMDETQKGFNFRQRYWLRSYLGYPHVCQASPNTTHYALAALLYSSHISKLITQNVDGLHHKSLKSIWSLQEREARLLEIHGTLHKVRCKHGHLVNRNQFQEWISASNPVWKKYTKELERTGNQPRTNPDGDVDLEGVSYGDFVVPECPMCLLESQHNRVHKPEVIFFGESIPTELKDRSMHVIESCDRLFIVGTTLSTYSAYRLLKHAVDLKKLVLVLNVGPTRADGHVGIEKIDIPSGTILTDVAKGVIGRLAQEDPIVKRLLRSGIRNPPTDDDEDRAPRAAG